MFVLENVRIFSSDICATVSINFCLGLNNVDACDRLLLATSFFPEFSLGCVGTTRGDCTYWMSFEVKPDAKVVQFVVSTNQENSWIAVGVSDNRNMVGDERDEMRENSTTTKDI